MLRHAILSIPVQKKTVKMSRAHTRERRLREYGTQKKEGQRRAASNIADNIQKWTERGKRNKHCLEEQRIKSCRDMIAS